MKTEEKKLIVAKASFVNLSPRKLRLVADAVRKLSPQQAVDSLKLLNKRAAKSIREVILQGIGNAKNNFQISPAELTIHSLAIEEGPRGPKRMDKSHSARFNRGIKRKKMAHIVVKLATKERKQNGTKS